MLETYAPTMRALLSTAGLISILASTHCSANSTSSHGEPPPRTSEWGSGPATVTGVAAFGAGVARITLALRASYAGPSSTSGADAGPAEANGADAGAAEANGADAGTFNAAAITASGTVVTATSSVPLQGTFDATTGALSVNGNGYAFNGNADLSGISGFANDPKSAGDFALIPGTRVATWCGSFEGAWMGAVGFVFASDGRATLVYDVPKMQVSGAVGGSVQSGSVSFVEAVTVEGKNLKVTGTLSGNSAHGTWSDSATVSGTWGAAPCK